MTNFKKQAFSVLAAGSLLVSVASPAFAGTTIQISGNGAGSDNYTKVEQTNTTTVAQNNTANVTNNVSSKADTGNNDAGFNTGGDVTIDTGNAQTSASVTNTLNSNAAEVSGCNCEGDTEVKISGNGAFSDNTVTLDDSNVNSVTQTNVANVTNNVDNNAKTGGNDANSNTGGDVTIHTGNAKAIATVETTANSNAAMIGGGAGAGRSASFVISGNGAGSDNWIDAELANVNTVGQSNVANVTNNVDSNAKTGWNDAGFNTGGEVVIHTGDAWSGAKVDNMVNFNSANLDCGCVLDVLAKIDGNGAEPFGHEHGEYGQFGGFHHHADNVIMLDLTSVNAAEQGNVANLTNNVEAKAKTGGNDADLNTGDPGSDPSIMTGNATNVQEVSNSGNVNTVGEDSFDLPLPGDMDLSLSFNLQALLAFFGMHWSN